MAFTTTERAAIRTYLGFSDQWKDLDTRLEGQLDTISAEAETRVRADLVRLASLDTRLDGALDNLDASVARDVELNPRQLEQLRAHGRTLIHRIAVVFHLEPPRDYYGASGADLGGVISLG